MMGFIYKLTLILTLILSINLSAYAGSGEPPAPTPAPQELAQTLPEQSTKPQRNLSYNYPEMFDLAIRLLVRAPVKAFLKEVFKEELTIDKDTLRKSLKLSNAQLSSLEIPDMIKDVSQSQLIMLLQENPQTWDLLHEYLSKVESGEIDDSKLNSPEQKEIREKYKSFFRKFIDDSPEVKAKFIRLNDPRHTYSLVTGDGKPAVTRITTYSNHVSIRGRTTNLKQVLLDFINQTEKEIALNIFDIDIQEVADALIKKALEGKSVSLGIDKSNVDAKPGAAAIVAKIEEHNAKHKDHQIFLRQVESSNYNHQKLGARDWSVKGKGAVYASSGNATYSCIDPKGDPTTSPIKSNQRGSNIPNANNTVILEGDLLAQFVRLVELRKTIDLGLSGKEYPLSGIFKFFIKSDRGAQEDNFTLFSSAPKGGITGDLNIDFYSYALMRSKGRIRGIQYSASSEYLTLMLMYYIEKEIAEGRDPLVEAISDTAGAMREWSIFLRLIGYKRNVAKDGTVTYRKIGRSMLQRRMSETQFQKLKDSLLVAPPAYGNHTVDLEDGTTTTISSKIHHKIWIFGEGKDAVIFIAVSGNSSQGSTKNTEQIFMFKNQDVVEDGNAIFEDLKGKAELSIEKLAILRSGKPLPDDPDREDGDAPRKVMKAPPASSTACDPLKKI